MDERQCVFCHANTAEFEESFRVWVFVDDEQNTMPEEYVHMTQPDSYWFKVDNVIANIDGLAIEYSDDNSTDIPGCHMSCYVTWLAQHI